MSRSSKRLGIPEGQNKSRQISGSSSTGLPRPRSTRSAKRPQKLAHDVGAVAQNWQHVGPNGPPFDSRGIGGADDSAHRRAGDWLRGESPLRLRLLAPRHGQFLVRHRLQARSLPSADEHLVCDRGFRPQRLLFAFSAYRPPTNIASAESLRPFYAIHGPVCSPLRFSNIAAERSNR